MCIPMEKKDEKFSRCHFDEARENNFFKLVDSAAVILSEAKAPREIINKQKEEKSFHLIII